MKETKAKFLVKSLTKDMAQEIQLASDVSWFGAILDELQEDLDVTDGGIGAEAPGIWFKGELTRRSNGKFGEMLFLTGELSARFYTNCIKTGKIMIDSLETAVQAVFVDEEMVERYDLADEITIDIENEEYELYSYQNDVADLAHVLHEHTFLNKNPYPSLETEE